MKLRKNVPNAVIGYSTEYKKKSGDTWKNLKKSTFNSELKKLVGSTKKTKVSMHKNTKANRNKYLK